MSSSAARGLVLDANMLIRCVLGSRARELVLTHLDEVAFFTPRECFEDARPAYQPGPPTGWSGYLNATTRWDTPFSDYDFARRCLTSQRALSATKMNQHAGKPQNFVVPLATPVFARSVVRNVDYRVDVADF